MPFHIATSSDPQHLRRVGPLVPGAWADPAKDPLVDKIEGNFLIDTGAGGILIDADVASDLQLTAGGAGNLHGIGGHHDLSKYSARLLLPATDSAGEVMFSVLVDCFAAPGLRRKHQEFGVDVIGLLGRLFLQFVRLEVDGCSGKVSLHIDDSILSRRD